MNAVSFFSFARRAASTQAEHIQAKSICHSLMKYAPLSATYSSFPSTRKILPYKALQPQCLYFSRRGPLYTPLFLTTPLTKIRLLYLAHLKKSFYRNLFYQLNPQLTKQPTDDRLPILWRILCIIGGTFVLLSKRHAIAHADDDTQAILAKLQKEKEDNLQRDAVKTLKQKLNLEIDLSANRPIGDLVEDCLNKIDKKKFDEIETYFEHINVLKDQTGKNFFLRKVIAGDEEFVTKMIGGESAKQLDTKKNNALMLAVAAGQKSLIKLLVHTYHFSLRQINSENKTVLHIAIEKGDISIAQLLYDTGSPLEDWKLPDGHFLHPIILAVQSGNPDMVDWVFKYDKNTFFKPNASQILHKAIKYACDQKKSSSTISQGEGPATASPSTETQPIESSATDEAVKQAHENDCKLLKHIINTYSTQIINLFDSVDERRMTPLQLAAFEGITTAIQILVKHGVSVNQTIIGVEKTPLFWAAEGRQLEAIKTLDNLGADLSQSDIDGKTPLSLLLEAIKTLDNLGVDLSQSDIDGKTPLLLLIDQEKIKANKCKNCLSMLIERRRRLSKQPISPILSNLLLRISWYLEKHPILNERCDLLWYS